MGNTASFRSDPESLHDIREFVRERAEASSWPADRIDELVQAVNEACANSVLHSDSTSVRVTWKARTNSVEVQVQDDGVFGGMEKQARNGGGLGITIMRALVDELDIHRGTTEQPGTVVRLVKKEHRSGTEESDPATPAGAT